MRNYSFFLILSIALQLRQIYADDYEVSCDSVSSEQCSSTLGCSLNNFTSANVNMANLCDPFTDPINCQNNGCLWSGCTGNISWPIDCSTLDNEEVCLIVSDCEWNSDRDSNKCHGTIMDITNCSMLNTNYACSMYKGCQWTNALCIGDLENLRDCEDLWGSPPVCHSVFGCSTKCTSQEDSKKNRPCYQISNMIDCWSIEGCYWDLNACNGDAGTTNCSQIRSSSLANFGCPNGTTCAKSACGDIKSNELCNKFPNCVWSLNVCIVGGAGKLMLGIVSLALFIMPILL